MSFRHTHSVSEKGAIIGASGANWETVTTWLGCERGLLTLATSNIAAGGELYRYLDNRARWPRYFFISLKPPSFNLVASGG